MEAGRTIYKIEKKRELEKMGDKRGESIETY